MRSKVRSICEWECRAVLNCGVSITLKDEMDIQSFEDAVGWSMRKVNGSGKMDGMI